MKNNTSWVIAVIVVSVLSSIGGSVVTEGKILDSVEKSFCHGDEKLMDNKNTHSVDFKGFHYFCVKVSRPILRG